MVCAALGHRLRKDGHVKAGRTEWFKFTEEQKHAAVSHYLGNGHNASATVRALGYPSHTLLGAWIKEIAPEAVKPRKDRVECSLEQKTAAKS
jgi:transposase-like protein